jgi:leucyl-tRNA synthetase
MFLGPLEVSKPWVSAGIVGVSRFLERLWAIGEKPCSLIPDPQSLKKLLHKTIKKVSEDTATINFNTAISAMMIYSSELAKLTEVPRDMWEPLVIMAGAYAPHLGEELWEKLGNKGSVSQAKWPVYDGKLTTDDEVNIVVQVNGKVRDKFTVPVGTAKETLEKTAFDLPGVKKWLDGQTVLKVIVIPDKLVNIVIK